jgi:hypothetical protein
VTFLQASGRDTLEGLQGDQAITASIEIPDREPGRPRKRAVPVERSTVDLPASLWQEVDKAKGAASRRAYIEAAIREKLERESAPLITAASFRDMDKEGLSYWGHAENPAEAICIAGLRVAGLLH